MGQVCEEFKLPTTVSGSVWNDRKTASTTQKLHEAPCSAAKIPDNGTENKGHDGDSRYRVESDKMKFLFRFTDVIAFILPLTTLY